MSLDRGPVVLFLALVSVSFIWFWITQFVQLMLMTDLDFPGRLDKAIWGLIFVLFFFLAPFAFFAWKSAYLERLESVETSSEGSKKTATSV